jgi:hypothetical protein
MLVYYFSGLMKKKRIIQSSHRREHNIGHVAEWLGTGLQNLLLRFDPAHDLFSFMTPLVLKSRVESPKTAERCFHTAPC